MINLNTVRWDEWHVKVVTDPTPFPQDLPIRRVSINSFGYGGTKWVFVQLYLKCMLITRCSGHVIIDNVESVIPDYQYHKSLKSGKSRYLDVDSQDIDRPQLLVWSAYDKNSLKANIENYSTIASNVELPDLAHTLANHRSILPVRAFTVCSRTSLSVDFTNAPQTIAEHKKPATLAFAFTGRCHNQTY